MSFERPEQPRRRQALDFVDQPKAPMFEAARHANPTGGEVGPSPEDKRYYEDLCLLLKIEPPDLDENQRKEWQRQSENGKKRARAAQRLEAQGFKDATDYINAQNIPDFKNLGLVRHLATAEVVALTGDQMDDLYNDGINFDIVASVNSYKRELGQTDTVERTNIVEPVPHPESTKVFYPRILDDLETATQPFQRTKGVTDATDLRLARLHNARIQEALDNLDAAGVDTTGFVGKGGEVRRSRNRLTVAVANVQLALAGQPNRPDELGRSIDYLSQMGVDVSRLVLPEIATESESGITPEASAVRTIEDEIRGVRERNTVGGMMNLDNAVFDLQGMRLSLIRRASGRGGVLNESDIRSIDAEIQRLVQEKGREVLTAREAGLNPLRAAVSRPLLGHPEEYRVPVGQSSYEIRVLDKERAFDGERVEELLMTAFESALRTYNAAVDDANKPNLSPLSEALTVIKERQKALGLAFDERKMPSARALVSMEGVNIGLDVDGIMRVLREKGIDLDRLDDGVLYSPEEVVLLKTLPEYKALVEMDQIEKWTTAVMEVLSFLSSTRLKGSGDKLESLASLGAEGRVSISTDSIIAFWTMERIGRMRSEMETPSLTEYYERASDLEDTICDVSSFGELPNPVDLHDYRSKIDALVLEFLRDENVVESGAKRKNEFVFMNRYARGYSGRNLARYEAFVTTLLRNENDGLLRQVGGVNEDAWNSMRSRVRLAIDQGESNAVAGRRPALSDEDRRIAFAYANQVAASHVLGESDRRSLLRVWGVRKPDDELGYGSSAARYEGTDYIGNLVVGEYPACTAAASVEHFAVKIMADLRRGKLIIPTTLPEVIRRGWLAPSLSKTFMENTTIRIVPPGGDRATAVVTLQSLRDRHETYALIAKRLVSQDIPRAHAGYLKQLSSAIRLRELLTCAKKEDISALYEDRLRRDIADTVDAALGVEYDDPRKKELVDGVTASIYIGLFGMLTGVTTDLTGETDVDVRELIRMQGEVRTGKSEAEAKIRLALYRLLYASAENGTGNSFIEKKGAPMSREAWGMFREIIDGRYKKIAGYSMTQEIPMIRARLIYNDRTLRAQNFWDSLPRPS